MNATHAHLVSFLTRDPILVLLLRVTTGYVVDSIINPDTHKIMTYGTEYVLDDSCADIPTGGNAVTYLDYYDWY